MPADFALPYASAFVGSLEVDCFKHGTKRLFCHVSSGLQTRWKTFPSKQTMVLCSEKGNRHLSHFLSATRKYAIRTAFFTKNSFQEHLNATEFRGIKMFSPVGSFGVLLGLVSQDVREVVNEFRHQLFHLSVERHDIQSVRIIEVKLWVQCTKVSVTHVLCSPAFSTLLHL